MKVRIVVVLFFMTGCLPETRNQRDKTIVFNSAHTVDEGYGRVLEHNPVVLSDNPDLHPNTDLNQFLSKEQDFITFNPILSGECLSESSNHRIDDCFRVQKDRESEPLSSIEEGKWAFPINTEEFWQVHTFYHMKKSINRFHSSLQFAHGYSTSHSYYNSSLPTTLFSSYSHWEGRDITLFAYTHCDYENNASFSAATFSLCLGYISWFPWIYMVQDPSILYHELGHAYIRILLNMRNSSFPIKTDLGTLFYDEAGAIGEGIADYFSFIVNHRTHIGEWGLGLLSASRPMKESDPLHISVISTDEDSRLSYPDFIDYHTLSVDTSSEENFIAEDIHYAGQIISHYLVALTEDIENHCSVEKHEAVSYVLFVLAETFSEMGDLTSRGSDSSTEDTINLTPSNFHSHDWNRMVLPINFRTFSQKVGKYLRLILNDPNSSLCSDYPPYRIEKLQDSYGLLLYKTYNENGNNKDNGHNGISSQVDLALRLKTVLIPKRYIGLDSRENAPQAFFFDKRSVMKKAIQNMQSLGLVGTLSPQTDVDLRFNNSNGAISPGEVVGVFLNLFNSSNSVMAGVQVLGNDWDHGKEGQPCNTFEDRFPSAIAGAADEDNIPPVPGDCNYITRENGDEEEEFLYPVCFVELSNEDTTRWAGQHELMELIDLDPDKCLSGSEKTDDCFIRAIKGVEQSSFSKIAPQSTWVDTFFQDGNGSFTSSNLIFFEVNRKIPTGTRFNCRFRVRFSNCDDCFSDSSHGHDDYLDYEYSGGRPFKIINLQFDILD